MKGKEKGRGEGKEPQGLVDTSRVPNPGKYPGYSTPQFKKSGTGTPRTPVNYASMPYVNMQWCFVFTG